jgi:acyl carrier protein
MADLDKKKDLWDKISSVTPLVLGIAVTGVGAFFTQIYNFRQLQLNQIAALEKLRPLLSSEKAEEREFGYASFAALGYEEIAIRIIQLKKDQSGRTVLVELKKASTPQVQANASEALKSLDEAKSLVNKLEFGDPRGLDAWMERGGKLADEVGLRTKLGRALISAELINGGPGRVRRVVEATTKAAGGSPVQGTDEKVWVREYLNQMGQVRSPLPRPFTERRIREFRDLIDRDDWDLKTYKSDAPTITVERGAQRDAASPTSSQKMEAPASITQRVKKIVLEQLGVPEEKITLKARFIEDLGADSLDVVELVMAVEEEFDIEIADEECEKMLSVGDVIAHVQRLYSQSQAGSTTAQ